jgi:hypothetical protein
MGKKVSRIFFFSCIAFSIAKFIFVRLFASPTCLFSVRRVKKTRDPVHSTSSSTSANENVEIITRPDGKKVRRIRKTKPNPSDKTNQLSGFLDSQPKTPIRGAATVSGASFNQPETEKNAEDTKKNTPSLGSLLGNMDSKPQKMGSASVAGDQVAVAKESSLTGEVYIRGDGKKGKIYVICICICLVHETSQKLYAHIFF